MISDSSAASFGLCGPGDFSDPDVISALDEICLKTRQAGILLGAYAETDLSKWIRSRKIQYLGCINDTGALMSGFRQMIEKVHHSL